ncbi:uncharacterized protein FA14DRAFT_36069 [Meira miltonrushii]|uniref:Uncharacterized protein n=1 Tax=Meira miltonrushii TaxID=1280837 RepID=A0A316VBV0_9BASI|nr:uncharacterized protein FA14DRAFT_36069 [Meira miltonrushii]PWN34950.1 hypothetical protein FA14DRAFT_36069 [Meira miltonrushii]
MIDSIRIGSGLILSLTRAESGRFISIHVLFFQRTPCAPRSARRRAQNLIQNLNCI